MADYNSQLPVRTENNGDVVVKVADATTPSQQLAVDSGGRISVKPTDGTNSQNYTAAGEAKVSVTQPLPAGTNAIGTVNANLRDGGGTNITSQVNGAQRALDVGVNVAGVQVDPRAIRALTSTDVVSANIRDNTGTAFSASNPLPVTMASNPPGTEINDYNTAASIAANATSNHDYTVTALKTLYLSQIEATASAKLKIEVQVESGVATGTFATKFVGFNSTSEPNIHFTLSQPITVAAGVRVRVIRTNKDNQSQDVYSTICGNEV